MASLDVLFNDYANKVKTLTRQPSNDELSSLYGLYKQATMGDNNTSKPSFLDLKGRAKWDAWTAKKGVSQDDAKRQYIEFVKKLL